MYGQLVNHQLTRFSQWEKDISKQLDNKSSKSISDSSQRRNKKLSTPPELKLRGNDPTKQDPFGISSVNGGKPNDPQDFSPPSRRELRGSEQNHSDFLGMEGLCAIKQDPDGILADNCAKHEAFCIPCPIPFDVEKTNASSSEIITPMKNNYSDIIELVMKTKNELIEHIEDNDNNIDSIKGDIKLLEGAKNKLIGEVKQIINDIRSLQEDHRTLQEINRNIVQQYTNLQIEIDNLTKRVTESENVHLPGGGGTFFKTLQDIKSSPPNQSSTSHIENVIFPNIPPKMPSVAHKSKSSIPPDLPKDPLKAKNSRKVSIIIPSNIGNKPM